MKLKGLFKSDEDTFWREGNFKTAMDPAANQSNVSLIYHGGKLLSLGEAGLPYEHNPHDLSTIGPHDYQGKLATAKIYSGSILTPLLYSTL